MHTGLFYRPQCAVYCRLFGIFYALFNIKPSFINLVYFQPIGAAHTRTVRFEVLIHWPQKEDGFISPAELIPAMEKARFFSKITAWIIEKAMSHVSVVSHSTPKLTININLSVTDLHDPTIIDLIAKYLNKFQLPAEIFTFETTESAIMYDTKKFALVFECPI